MCVLQDFEALTPNLLARTIETVEGGWRRDHSRRIICINPQRDAVLVWSESILTHDGCPSLQAASF